MGWAQDAGQFIEDAVAETENTIDDRFLQAARSVASWMKQVSQVDENIANSLIEGARDVIDSISPGSADEPPPPPFTGGQCPAL